MAQHAEQFWDGSQAAGAALLKSVEAMSEVEAGRTHVYHTFDGQLRRRVGIHDAATLAGRHPYGIPRPVADGDGGGRAGQRRGSFPLHRRGPSPPVIVTDTRTWRTFPFAGLEQHPELMDENG